MKVFDVSFDEREVERFKKIVGGFGGGDYHAGLKGAVRKALSVVRREMADQIVQDYRIKRSEVIRSMYMQLGYRNAHVLVQGRRRTLHTYYLSPGKGFRPSRGLLGAVRKDRTPVRFEKGFFVHQTLPIIRTGPGKNKSWEGLHVLIGPSIAQLARTVTLRHDIAGDVNDVFVEELNRYLKLVLAGKIIPGRSTGFNPDTRHEQNAGL